MKFNSIINRYIFKELIPPFTMNLAFFMFVFLMRQILDITNLIVNYHVGFSNFFLMLAYSMPFFLVYVIPMSTMMAVLLTFIRLSNDNEIIALKSAGVSIYQLMPPVMLFSATCASIAAVMFFWGLPWGNSAYKHMAIDVVKTNLNIGLKERQFNDSFDGVMFYVSKIDLKDRTLSDIFIEDQRKEGVSSTVIAPKGFLFQGPDKFTFIIRLYNGMINQVILEKKTAHSVKFDTYDLQLDLKDAVNSIKSRKKNKNEMSVGELLNLIKHAETKDAEYYAALIEFHKKFSLPFACIVLAILAMPLGIQSHTAKRSAGLGIGLFAFLIYYLLLSAGLVFGETGKYPPALGMWMPNIIMGGAGWYLLVKTANDRPVRIFMAIQRVKAAILKYFGFGFRKSA